MINLNFQMTTVGDSSRLISVSNRVEATCSSFERKSKRGGKAGRYRDEKKTRSDTVCKTRSIVLRSEPLSVAP